MLESLKHNLVRKTVYRQLPDRRITYPEHSSACSWKARDQVQRLVYLVEKSRSQFRISLAIPGNASRKSRLAMLRR